MINGDSTTKTPAPQQKSDETGSTRDHAPETRYPVIEQGMLNAINGTLTSIKGQPGSYHAQPGLGNRHLPDLGPACVNAIKSRSDESAQVSAARVLGLIWYDDQLVTIP